MSGQFADLPDDVVVVGGGIGGLATALAAARAGRRVRVIERAPAFGEIGAGLQLGPNAMRAFERLGVYDVVARSAVFPARAVVRDAVDGSILTVLNFGDQFVRRYGYPYAVAHRRDVLDALIEACRDEPAITLTNGITVAGVVEADHGVVLRLSDGSAAAARVVVGADGINSEVRQLIDNSEPRSSGHVAFRGAVPVDSLSHDVASDEVLLWIGPGIHLMQYPVRSGKMYNQVAVYERSPEKDAHQGDARDLEVAFSTACEFVRRSVAMIDTARSWPVSDRSPLPTWSTAHAVLIGDAAHAMLQYLGQGACQALEDALELGAALGLHPDEPAAAFEAYERVRVPTASRCQVVARPWGDLWHTADETVLALRNRLFRMRRSDDYADLDWLYLERPESLLSSLPESVPRWPPRPLSLDEESDTDRVNHNSKGLP